MAVASDEEEETGPRRRTKRHVPIRADPQDVEAQRRELDAYNLRHQHKLEALAKRLEEQGMRDKNEPIPSLGSCPAKQLLRGGVSGGGVPSRVATQTPSAVSSGTPLTDAELCEEDDDDEELVEEVPASRSGQRQVCSKSAKPLVAEEELATSSRSGRPKGRSKSTKSIAAAERVRAAFQSVTGFSNEPQTRGRSKSQRRDKSKETAGVITRSQHASRKSTVPAQPSKPGKSRRKKKDVKVGQRLYHCDDLPAPQKPVGKVTSTLEHAGKLAHGGSYQAALLEVQKYCGIEGYNQVRCLCPFLVQLCLL